MPDSFENRFRKAVPATNPNGAAAGVSLGGRLSKLKRAPQGKTGNSLLDAVQRSKAPAKAPAPKRDRNPLASAAVALSKAGRVAQAAKTEADYAQGVAARGGYIDPSGSAIFPAGSFGAAQAGRDDDLLATLAANDYGRNPRPASSGFDAMSVRKPANLSGIARGAVSGLLGLGNPAAAEGLQQGFGDMAAGANLATQSARAAGFESRPQQMNAEEEARGTRVRQGYQDVLGGPIGYLASLPQNIFTSMFTEPGIEAATLLDRHSTASNQLGAGVNLGLYGAGMLPGLDVVAPALAKGAELAAPALSKAQGAIDRAVLSKGLNRPIGVGWNTYGEVFRQMAGAGVDRADSGAYAGLTAQRARVVGEDAFSDLVPTVERVGQLPGDARGSVAFGGDRPAIRLGPDADSTTPGHELLHVFRQSLDPLEAADFSRMTGALESGWDRNAEEAFASLGEQFLQTGQAPTSGLRSSFRHLRQAFTDVYGAAPEVNDQAGAAFRSLFTGRRSPFQRDVARAMARLSGVEFAQNGLFSDEPAAMVSERLGITPVDLAQYERYARHWSDKGLDPAEGLRTFGLDDPSISYILNRAGVKRLAPPGPGEPIRGGLFGEDQGELFQKKKKDLLTESEREEIRNLSDDELENRLQARWEHLTYRETIDHTDDEDTYHELRAMLGEDQKGKSTSTSIGPDGETTTVGQRRGRAEQGQGWVRWRKFYTKAGTGYRVVGGPVRMRWIHELSPRAVRLLVDMAEHLDDGGETVFTPFNELAGANLGKKLGWAGSSLRSNIPGSVRLSEIPLMEVHADELTAEHLGESKIQIPEFVIRKVYELLRGNRESRRLEFKLANAEIDALEAELNKRAASREATAAAERVAAALRPPSDPGTELGPNQWLNPEGDVVKVEPPAAAPAAPDPPAPRRVIERVAPPDTPFPDPPAPMDPMARNQPVTRELTAPAASGGTLKAGVRNTFIEGLTGLRGVDPVAYEAARQLGSSEAEANLIMKKVAEVVDKKLGAGTLGQLVPQLNMSRFIGIFDRWGRIAQDLKRMDAVDLAMKINGGDLDPLLETMPIGRKARNLAKKALTLRGGETVTLPDGRRAVLLDLKGDNWRVQFPDGTRETLWKPPTPVRFKRDLLELRKLLEEGAIDAQGNVALLIAGGGKREGQFIGGTVGAGEDALKLSQLRPAVESERQSLMTFAKEHADLLEQYRGTLEAALRDVHQRNQGIETTDLGPLGTYVPLQPLTKGEAEVSPRFGKQRLQYNRPDNPRNSFASGLAMEYDMTVQGVADALSDATRTNNKAALMDRLKESGLLVPQSRGGVDPDAMADLPFVTGDTDPVIVYPDGTEVPAAWVPLSADKFVENAFGKLQKSGNQRAAVPLWLYDELKPILDSQPLSRNAEVVREAVQKVNVFAMAGPADAYFHAINVMGTLRSLTPWPSDTLIGKTLGNTPLTKWLSTMIELARVNTSDAAAMADLREMARLGALPGRYGSETYSPRYAASTGAELRGPAALKHGEGSLASRIKQAATFGPTLYGPSGLDTRARLMMWRISKAVNPDASSLEHADFVNHLGAYNKALNGKIEHALKSSGLSPFFTAGRTMIENGLRSLVGVTKLPTKNLTRAQRLSLWTAQQLSGGAVGYLATWATMHRAVTGKWPWEDRESQLGQIPVPMNVRNSPTGRRIWGNNGGTAYVSLSFFLPIVDRGLRASGIKGGYDTAALGGNVGQVGDAALKGAINTFGHPIVNSPMIQTAFMAGLGAEPYLADFRDGGGRRNPVLLAMTPDVGGGVAQLGVNTGYAALDLNPVLGGAVRAGVQSATGGRVRVPEPDWLREQNDDRTALLSVLSYAFPRLLTSPKDLDRKRGQLRKQQRATSRNVRKDLKQEPAPAGSGSGAESVGSSLREALMGR